MIRKMDILYHLHTNFIKSETFLAQSFKGVPREDLMEFFISLSVTIPRKFTTTPYRHFRNLSQAQQIDKY